MLTILPMATTSENQEKPLSKLMYYKPTIPYSSTWHIEIFTLFHK